LEKNMNSCEAFQHRLLDDSYGLLDDAEHAALLDHVQSCAACQTAQARLSGQRELLASAAKTEFPQVRFVPPAAESVIMPIAAAAPAQARANRRWLGWAVAASLLLGLLGLGAWEGLRWYGHYQDLLQARASHDLALKARARYDERRSNERVRVETDIQAIQEQIKQLEGRWNQEVDQLKQESAAKDLEVIITGPKSVQAGAQNNYEVVTRKWSDDAKQPRGGEGKHLPARVQAALLDPKTKQPALHPTTQQPLFQQIIESTGVCQLQLPADLPVKPGTEWTLHVTAESRDGKQAQVSGQLALTGPLYLTHLATDRPMYRPGETVHFRSLTLERFSHKPAQEDFQLHYRIVNGKNEEVFKLDGTTRVLDEPTKAALRGPDGGQVRGIGAGEYLILLDLAGGEYALEVKEGQNRFAPQTRKFLVNNYPAPRLNKELEFARKSYGPGEAVEVSCKVSRVERGAAIAAERVTATAHVDGQRLEVALEGQRVRDGEETFDGTRPDGSITVKFRLPDAIGVGEGSLAVQFKDGGTRETIVRPIPIVLKKLLVEFFPEGGDLVAGVPNRVYFQARTTLGKPAELRGRIVDDQGNHVVHIHTVSDNDQPGVNQGMGLFELTPRFGRKYELKMDAPIGIEGRYVLPAVQRDGVVLSIPEGVIRDKIDVRLRSERLPRKLLVGAYCRGRLIDHQSVTAQPGATTELSLRPPSGVGGVYRVTVFEERQRGQLVPVAERLVYRRAVEHIDFEVKLGKELYCPGDKVKLGLKSLNEKKQPVPAIVVVSVVDQGNLKLADEKTARAMPTHFFLTTEVREPDELEYADFLVSPHPKAAQALDLLLGTQGWRRFAEQHDPKDFRDNKKKDGEKLLVALGQTAPLESNLAERAIEKIDSGYFPKYQELQQSLGQREEGLDERDQFADAEYRRLLARISETETAYRAADDRLAQFLDHVRLVALITLSLVLLTAGVGSWIVAYRRQAEERPAAGWYLTSVASCGFLILAGLLVASLYLGDPEDHLLAFMRPGQAGNDNKEMARMKAEDERVEFKLGAPPGALNLNVVPDKAAIDMVKDAKIEPNVVVAPPVVLGAQLAPVAPREADIAPAPVPPGDGKLRGAKKLERAEEPRPNNAALFMEQGKVLDEWMKEFRDQKKLAGQRMPQLEDADRPGFGVELMHLERELRKNRRWHELAELRLNIEKNRLTALPVQNEPFVVRQYALQRKPGGDAIRRDFTETLYWHPVLVLPGDKQTEVTFDLSDSVTRFQVQVWGHTLDGRLGATTAEIASRLPFSVEPSVPIEISSRDQITIPVTVANSTNKSLSVQLRAEAEGLQIVGTKDKNLAVDADKRLRQLFQFQPALVDGTAKVRFFGLCQPLGADSVERLVKVVPDGFPVTESKSDLLEKVAEHVVTLPDKREHWIPGTLKLQAQVYPSTLADLQKGLEALLREPCGCFEQSSTSNYPNVLILNYLKESEQTRPEVEKRARQLMTSGYQKLTSFECDVPSQSGKRQGYEWFGGAAPPHEALTAYGLLQFMDMAKVHSVDPAMLERTRQYLLAQRDGKGGFMRNARALDSFGGAPEHITNAYIVWAVTESGATDNLDVELKALREEAKKSKDPYFIALVGNSLLNRDKAQEGLELLRQLTALQKADGNLTGTTTSITRSGGRELEIETTALATLAWLKANRPAEFNDPVRKAVQWLGKQRGGHGGFGATQSTILALKALIAHTKANKKTAEAGELKLYVNDRAEPFAVTKFAAGAQDALVVKLADESLLKPGANKVRVEITGNNQFPHTLSWSYQAVKPANPDNCPVRLKAELDRPEASEGETVRLTATVSNDTGKGQGMAVAILGLPGGLTIPEDMKQLKQLAQPRENGTKPGKISAFEIRGRELVLYWRDLGPDQTITVNLDLICRVPGQYRGPASRAYLYYNADRRFWVEPLTVTIRPKTE
jgi:hypothetical protein